MSSRSLQLLEKWCREAGLTDAQIRLIVMEVRAFADNTKSQWFEEMMRELYRNKSMSDVV